MIPATMRTWLAAAVVVFAGVLAPSGPAQDQGAPVIVVETSRGSFAFETYPDEAPKTVGHAADVRCEAHPLERRDADAGHVDLAAEPVVCR